MGLFAPSPPPAPPPPPPPPPAASPPVYASAATMGALARRTQGRPMGGTDLTTGQKQAGVVQTAALGLGGTGTP
jgi:hypothetical protein